MSIDSARNWSTLSSARRTRRRSTERGPRVPWLLLVLMTLALGVTALCPPAARADAVDEEIARIRAEIAANGYCWTAGRTSRMEMAPEERRLSLGLIVPPGESGMLTQAEIDERPAPGTFRSYFSWKDEGIMTPVKNQGGCGSCWAFAPVAVLEAYIKRVTDVTQDLSEQQYVSCTSDGCGGGWMSTAYDLMRSYGAVGEICMPYRGRDDIPCTQSQCELVDKIQSYYGVGSSVSAIKAALANGPVSCAMTAYDDFNGYQGGCYQHSGYNPVNHAVAICGWDDAACSGQGAWLVKNSWGSAWGEDGYFWIRYGSCNIGYSAEQINYSPLYPVVVAHAALRNTDETEQGYWVSAQAYAYLAPVSSVKVQYRINGGAYSPITMSHVEGDTYAGLIPAQPIGTQIDYYIEARDTGGRIGYNPKDGPPEHHSFRVVNFVTLDNCESPGSWTMGVGSDNATSGRWDWGNPEGTTFNGLQVQSEDDSSVDPGVNCFATGRLSLGNVANNDVDEGTTTLLSPVYDLGDLDEVCLAFDLWYVNRVGNAPVDDAFKVDASSNGGSNWTNLLTINLGPLPGTWQRYSFDLQDRITLTSQVRIRWRASDTGTDNVVEAAVDEFELSTPEMPSRVGDGGPVLAGLRLEIPYPNPTAGGALLRFNLPQSGRVTLGIYGPQGRLERTLLRATLPAGPQMIRWDGRGDRNQQMPSGIYWVKLSHDAGEQTRPLIIVR